MFKNPVTPDPDLKTATLMPTSSQPNESAVNDSRPNDQDQRRRQSKPSATLKRSQADKRMDLLVKKHFGDDPGSRPLILELVELDPTPEKMDLAWLAKYWTGPQPKETTSKDQCTSRDAEFKQFARYLETHYWTRSVDWAWPWKFVRLRERNFTAIS